MNSMDCFLLAIKSGFLSNDKAAHNFAGKYMYMGIENGSYLFKHIDTRGYLKISEHLMIA